jgi:hypothetical protein
MCTGWRRRRPGRDRTGGARGYSGQVVYVEGRERGKERRKSGEVKTSQARVLGGKQEDDDITTDHLCDLGGGALAWHYTRVRSRRLPVAPALAGLDPYDFRPASFFTTLNALSPHALRLPPPRRSCPRPRPPDPAPPAHRTRPAPRTRVAAPPGSCRRRRPPRPPRPRPPPRSRRPRTSRCARPAPRAPACAASPRTQVVGIILAISSGVLIGTSFVFKKKGLLRSQAGHAAGEGVAYLKSVRRVVPSVRGRRRPAGCDPAPSETARRSCALLYPPLFPRWDRES